MSTSTLTPEARRNVALFSAGDLATKAPKMFRKKNDAGKEVLIIEGLPVFRSGTFRDSMGFQHTWESIHMDQMVANFEMLVNRSIFSDVPVRSGHPGWLVSGTEGTGKVVGYHTALRKEERTSKHDNKEYTYVLADVEVLDPAAMEAIEGGLWRNRSAEIGSYVTNDEAEFWPVYMGVAYVDIPAVEGLNGFSKHQNFSVMMEKETTVPGSQEESQQQAPIVPPTPPAPPAPPAAPAANAEHSAPSAPSFRFRIGGTETVDFGAVQSYIDGLENRNTALEEFQKETVKSNRASFVSDLVKSNRILAAQEEATVAFAQGLSPEQFEAWKATQEGAPANPLFGQFGQQPQGGEAPTPQQEKAKSQVELDKEIVAMHKRAGQSPENIKKTASYGRLLAADPSFKL